MKRNKTLTKSRKRLYAKPIIGLLAGLLFITAMVLSVGFSPKATAAPATGCYQQVANPQHIGYEKLDDSTCKGQPAFPSGTADPTQNCYIETVALDGSIVWNIDCSAITTGNVIDLLSTPQDPCDAGAQTGGTCQSVGALKGYLDGIITFLAIGVGVLIAISIVIGGVQYTTAGGDPQGIAAAKRRITNAIIALIAFAFMYAFLQFIIPGGINQYFL